MIRRLVRLVAPTCLYVTLLVPAAAIAQQPGVEFAVEPGPGSQTAEGGGYFLIRAETGERVRQSLVLRNESGARLRLKLAVVDATTGQLGGVSYGLPDDPIKLVGGWIVLDRTAVSLDPGDTRTVGFDVSVPSDVSGGQHIAGIAVWALGEEAEDGSEEAVSVVVQTRRIVAVQVDLPGPQDPELVVTGVEPAARPDGLYLEIGIENRGTAMTTGEGTIEIAAQGFLEDFFVDTFVPGTSIGYPIKWTDDPREGTYDARVEIDYEGRVAEWIGSFTVGDPVLADLEDRGVNVPGGFPTVPVAIASAGVAAVTVVWTVRRRNRRMVPRPAGPMARGPRASYGPDPTTRAPRPMPSGRRPPPPPPPPPPAHQ